MIASSKCIMSLNRMFELHPTFTLYLELFEGWLSLKGSDMPRLADIYDRCVGLWPRWRSIPATLMIPRVSLRCSHGSCEGMSKNAVSIVMSLDDEECCGTCTDMGCTVGHQHAEERCTRSTSKSGAVEVSRESR